MITSQNAASKTRILFDLKPALDGYAGIPQETRLLFQGLRCLDSLDVAGLIQHGARRLRPGLKFGGPEIPLSHRINRSSRVAVSLREIPRVGSSNSTAGGANPGDSGISTPVVMSAIGNFFSISLAQIGERLGLKMTPGIFEAGLFDDFIWRTFFSKTLKPADKECVTSACFRILRPSRKRLHQVGLAGRRWSSTPRYPSIDTQDFDVLLAQTPFPGRVSGGTKLVVRYHDAVPVFLPHTISDTVFHQASHYYALQENVRAGAYFSCVSESTRSDLLKIFPEVEKRASVIHNIVSDEYVDEPSTPDLVRQIIRNRLGQLRPSKTASEPSEPMFTGSGDGDLQYLLMVSTIEPRKNHLLLTAAWERLKYTVMPRLKLVVVGNLGWAHAPVLDAFRPWSERGELFLLSNVPSAELRVLYRHAAATVCPSLAEGFDYTGIEAMRSGGIVISSDIPVHREIYGEASAYFDPYSAEDAAAVIGEVLAEAGQGLRERLRLAGPQVSARYTRESILPRWDAYFRDINSH